jgi:tetratricopeptide (TPR) repeat protein
MSLKDIEKLREKVDKDPNSKLFVPLAEEYKKEGMLDEAINVLLTGLERQPGYTSAMVSLGKIYLDKGMRPEATDEFEKVIQQIPDNLFAHKKLAEIYVDTGKTDRAIKAFRTVLKLNPMDEDVATKLKELEGEQYSEEPPEKTELIEEAGTNVPQDIDLNVALEPERFNAKIGQEIIKYLDNLFKKYLDQYNLAVQKKEKLIYGYENTFKYDLTAMKDNNYNESLADLVRNLTVKNRVIEFKGRLLQIVDPIFNEPKNPKNILDYRTHFFTPKKYFLSNYFDTYWFNITVIWAMTILLYIALYFEWLKKIIDSFEAIGKKFKKKDSN